jgi:hypothetical protein
MDRHMTVQMYKVIIPWSRANDVEIVHKRFEKSIAIA